MGWKNTDTSYGRIAKSFHWVIALLIILLLMLGFYMTDLEMGPDKLMLFGRHKSLGITVLALALLRFAWKLRGRTPRLPDTLNAMEKLAAHAGHWLLYALMIAMPLSGWLMSSASGFPVSFFGLFILPDLIQPDQHLRDFFIVAHFYMAWALVVMIALHVLAALLHHFYYRDNVLRRMLPFTKEEKDARDSDTMVGC